MNRNRLLPLLFFGLSLMMQAANQPRVRISGWYWLNSAPKAEWARDFKNMHDLGFTDVVLAWGLDSAAFGIRVQDSQQAIRWAHKVGLGSYLCVWHPSHNSLTRRSEFQQVDLAGHHLFTFDTFNPEWRKTQWKDYLQGLARSYGKEPGMAGYLFDDSFGTGKIDSVSGPASPPSERYISYNDVERKMFGSEPPRSKSDPKWKEWTAARAKWWVQWGMDTVRSIREIDPNRDHDIYLEDGQYILSQDPIDRVGVNFGKVGDEFDAVCAYIEPAFSGKDADSKIVEVTRNSILKTRAAAGENKKIIFTFWVADHVQELKPEAATFPTVEQIKKVSGAALALGIRHLDMYGYRIGDYRVTDASWLTDRPGGGPSYKLTGQFPHKFLWDRKELFDGLKTYLHSIQNIAGK